MIKSGILGVLFFMSFVGVKKAPDFVVRYHELAAKKAELTYIATYKNRKEVSIQGYVVSLQMKQAKYKMMPWSKLKVFNTNKNKLEELISKNPNNVHLRYVRLVIQENIPSILGYTSSIKKDKQFLKEVLQKKDSTSYLHTYIINNTSL
ncbi:hypothetical protein C7448_101754 [Tenacibaculum gallaicum]|uniref:Uncharacterized protein n=1 Tax=Tenacibaculum gallaicum TaxID=561505 RepID=A0A3E0IDJ1_9FLAO|nr:hypothetical protein [Tenacibaculum gallaicum]REH56711.1 hypothetical protein C7448_101754 [Tenacibaculum gallaicum]